MGRKKETKPLLSNPAGGQSSSFQPGGGTYIVRKIHKGRTVKPKLSSVSETAGESSSHQGGKEMSKTKCLEKDVDESQPKQTEASTEGKSCSHSFGVRSYLHHFYETVNNSNTSGQVGFSYFIFYFHTSLCIHDENNELADWCKEKVVYSE
jgi:hypothetical protein